MQVTGIWRGQPLDASVGGISLDSLLRNNIALGSRLLAGGAEAPPGTDCIAGLGTASLLCLLLTAMKFGRIVFAAHRHSWSRSASRTLGLVFSP